MTMREDNNPGLVLRSLLESLRSFGLPAIVIAAITIGVAFAFGSELIDKIGYVDAGIALLYPIALGLLWHYVSVRSIWNNVEYLESSLADDIRSNKIILHGNKYKFPGETDRAQFWNNFLLQADHRFILVGHTNKSWVKGDEKQSELLSDSIIRIIKNDGSIRILSCTDKKYVEENMRFLRNYVIKRVKSDIPRLEPKAKDSIEYAILDGINYNAVVSDDRLVIIPRSNDADFRENDAVLEISPISHNDLYTNYMKDIDSIFRSADTVELPWDKQ